MGNTTVYVENVRINEITRNGNGRISTPSNLIASRSIQPKEFKKKPTPSVNVNLVAHFDMSPQLKWYTKKHFHFEVRDSKGKVVAKASNGYCAEKAKVFGHTQCNVYAWENEIKFSTIKITQPGLHEYTITQTSKSNDQFMCDNSVYHVRVTVKDMKSAPIVEYLNGMPTFRNQRAY